MSTDLNSEFTHFNLVIRLSKVQQLALRLCTFSPMSRCSGCPRVPRQIAFLSEWKRSEPSETSFSLLLQPLRWNMTYATEGNRHVLFLQVWSLGCCEVKHIVHLIVGTWKPFYALVADLNTGMDWHNARLLGFRNWSCCFANCFRFLSFITSPPFGP